MRKKHKLALLSACAGGLLLYAMQLSPVVRHYTVKSRKVGADGLRIVLLSDLHSKVYDAAFYEKIALTRPDLILLGGDIADERNPAGAQDFLQRVSRLAPCYYVSGNHEHWYAEPQAIFSQIESYGIHLLHNAQTTITLRDTTLNLCGLYDPAEYGNGAPRNYGAKQPYLAALSAFSLSDTAFNLLLAHRPESIPQYAEYGFDLSLHGHAHGGIWRIPGLMNGLIAPNQGFFPRYAGGVYQFEDYTAIVGRGLLSDYRVRLFNPPEIVCVQLSPK